MTGKLEYLPVPTMRRDRNRRPARTSVSCSASYFMASIGRTLPAADEFHDLDPVAVMDRSRFPRLALHDPVVHLDGDPVRLDPEIRDEPTHVSRRRQRAKLAVNL